MAGIELSTFLWLDFRFGDGSLTFLSPFLCTFFLLIWSFKSVVQRNLQLCNPVLYLLLVLTRHSQILLVMGWGRFEQLTMVLLGHIPNPSSSNAPRLVESSFLTWRVSKSLLMASTKLTSLPRSDSNLKYEDSELNSCSPCIMQLPIVLTFGGFPFTIQRKKEIWSTGLSFSFYRFFNDN